MVSISTRAPSCEDQLGSHCIPESTVGVSELGASLGLQAGGVYFILHRSHCPYSHRRIQC
jgi:hypothetical protein